MSTSYDFHCLDCEQTAEDACLYGEIGIETLREAWELRTEIVKVWQSSFWRVVGHARFTDYPVLKFLVNHKDHRVCIESEYGERLPVEAG